MIGKSQSHTEGAWKSAGGTLVSLYSKKLQGITRRTLHYLTDGEASKELLYSALIHDIGEFYTGDLPAPAKRDNPELATRIHDLDYAYLGQQNIEAPLLPESEKNLLRAADILDLIFTSRLEIQIGNDSFHEVFWRGIEYIAMVHLPTKAQARVNQIVDKLKENVSERE